MNFYTDTFLAPTPQMSEALEKWRTLVETAQSLEIKDRESMEYAVESGSLASRMLKWFTEERQRRTKPLKDEAKEIERDFAQIIDPLESIKTDLARKVTAFQEKLQREAQEAKRKADEQARMLAEQQAKGEMPSLVIPDEVIPPPEVPKTVHSVSGSTTVRTVWRVELVSMLDLVKAVASGAAPLEALTFNESFARKVAQAMKRDQEWPGVKMVQVLESSFR